MKRALVLLAMLSACSSPTELLLIVKAGAGLTVGQGGDIDTLRIEVQPASDSPTGGFYFTKYVELCTDAGSPDCRPQAFASTDYQGDLTLPVRFLLEPGSQGFNEDIRVWVDGLALGKARLSSGLRFQFSKGHRLWLELPLFTQCLDDLTCQAQDLACGIDRDCVPLTPTTKEPVDDMPTLAGDMPTASDMTMSFAHDFATRDLATAPDMALPCGTLNAVCCAMGMNCDATLQCSSGNRCVNPAMKCGQPGQSCCNTTTPCSVPTTVCGADKLCDDCGGANEPCCAASSCSSGFTCNTTTMLCIACGGIGDVCCGALSSCASGLGCNDGTCACGFGGGPCCLTDAGVCAADMSCVTHGKPAADGMNVTCVN